MYSSCTTFYFWVAGVYESAQNLSSLCFDVLLSAFSHFSGGLVTSVDSAQELLPSLIKTQSPWGPAARGLSCSCSGENQSLSAVCFHPPPHLQPFSKPQAASPLLGLTAFVSVIHSAAFWCLTFWERNQKNCLFYRNSPLFDGCNEISSLRLGVNILSFSSVHAMWPEIKHTHSWCVWCGQTRPRLLGFY